MLNLSTPYERGQAAPQQVDIDLVSGEDRAYLETCAQIGLEGAGQEPELRVVALLKYLTSLLSLKAHGGSATAILRDGHAICAGMSRSFCALCRVSDIPCREVSLYGLRGMGSHVMAEAYYDEAWHLFDPTFGIFFRGADDRVCALHDLVCDPNAGEMICAVAEPWQGFDQAVQRCEPSPAPVDFMQAKYGFALPERYREWFATAYPVTYRQAATSFPVKIDLTSQPCFDCLAPGHFSEDTGNRIGIDPYTGWTSVGFAFCHTLLLTVVAGSFVELEYCFSDDVPDLQVMGLSNVRVLDRIIVGKSVTFRLHFTDREAVAMVTAQTFGRVKSIKTRPWPRDGE